MSTTFSAAEAKSRFGEALRLAERGETVEITRHGESVAVLVAAGRRRELRPLDEAEGHPTPRLIDLVGRYSDGDDFAAAVDEVVSGRSEAGPIPELEAG